MIISLFNRVLKDVEARRTADRLSRPPLERLHEVIAERMAPRRSTETLEETLGVEPDSTTDDAGTFFYPGSGLDLNPLRRLTHIYNRFVFCDLSTSERDFLDAFSCDKSGRLIRDLSNRRGNDWMRVDSVKRLPETCLPGSHHLIRNIEMSEDEMCRFERCRDLWVRGTPNWGYCVKLTRRFAGHERQITLYYLRTEGASTYWRLFTQRNAAPAALCVRPYFSDMGLEGADDLLARVVKASECQPVFLYGDMRWPAEQEWQEFGRGWNLLKASSTVRFRDPDAVCLPGRRRVMVHHGRIDPAVLDEMDAVLVTSGVRQARGWPRTGNYIPFERVGTNLPMAESLAQLDRHCTENRIERVASVPFGFEDEGIVLREWAQTAGFPHELHLYCPSIGDYHSLTGHNVESGELHPDTDTPRKPSNLTKETKPMNEIEDQSNNETLPALGAFESAILDALSDTERDVCFTLRMVGRGGGPCNIRDFMRLRREEEELIDRTASEYRARSPSVLDIGCGIGRHLRAYQEQDPWAKLTGVDSAPHLLEKCRDLVPNGTFWSLFRQIPADETFDVVMIMGNSLGVFGDEQLVRTNLRNVYDRLNPGGMLLVEAGPVMGRDFFVADHEIQYGDLTDGPFPWCYASRDWLHPELERIGFQIQETLNSSQPGPFFICRARKPESTVTNSVEDGT